MRRFSMHRLAQMPPMPMDPMAMGGGMPPAMPGAPPMPGMPPTMPGMPGAMPAAPMAAPTGPPKRQEISGPLDTLAKVLYDADVEGKIDNSTGSDPDEITLQVWQQYGGDPKGTADKNKLGARTEESESENQPDPQKTAAEDKATDKSRWQRLPEGKTIADVTSLEDMGKVIGGLLGGQVQQMAKANAAPPGGAAGGAPPAMAHRINMLLRFAQALDDQGCVAQADYIEYALIR